MEFYISVPLRSQSLVDSHGLYREWRDNTEDESAGEKTKVVSEARSPPSCMLRLERVQRATEVVGAHPYYLMREKRWKRTCARGCITIFCAVLCVVKHYSYKYERVLVSSTRVSVVHTRAPTSLELADGVRGSTCSSIRDRWGWMSGMRAEPVSMSQTGSQ